MQQKICAATQPIQTNIHLSGSREITLEKWDVNFLHEASKPNVDVVSSHNDYRIAMMLAVIGLKVPGITINQTECVTKEFRTFSFCGTNLQKVLTPTFQTNV